MILVVDMNFRRDSLGYCEFVLPIVYAVGGLDSVVVKHYPDLTTEDIEKSASIILSGTPLKDNATLNEPDRFSWLRNCKKPVMGICAGMQTIGLAFGADLKKCLGIGMTKIETLSPNPLFSSTFSAYALHNYSLGAPKDFDILAESDRCVEAIKLRHRDIFGVLFHPEVRNPEIIHRFTHEFGSTE
jgi:GMP synthase-like glutamine amidotransferase